MDWPNLDLDAAYRIQDEAFCLRMERGETATGIAATTVGETVVTSWLTDAMLARTRVVPPVAVTVGLELGFVLGRRVAGPALSAAGALAAIDRVHGVLHVRRTCGGGGAARAVAANGATLGFRLSSRSADVTALDLTLEGCVMEIDGEIAHAGIGAGMPGRDGLRLAGSRDHGRGAAHDRPRAARLAHPARRSDQLGPLPIRRSPPCRPNWPRSRPATAPLQRIRLGLLEPER